MFGLVKKLDFMGREFKLTIEGSSFKTFFGVLLSILKACALAGVGGIFSFIILVIDVLMYYSVLILLMKHIFKEVYLK